MSLRKLVIGFVIGCSVVSGSFSGGIGRADAAATVAAKIGFTEIEITDTQRQRPLPIKIWYPAAPSAVPTPQTYGHIFPGFAARDGAYQASEPRPLVLLSHGDRGNNANLAWLAESLARHGYIAVAVDHWLNTTENNTPEGSAAMWERPLDMSFVLTELLAHPIWSTRIDSRRIGAAGHSSGGYTVIALAGAIFSGELMQVYCASSRRGPDCLLTAGVDLSRLDRSRERMSARDPRIKAVFAMAPAVAQGIQPASLAAINIPVRIIATRDDELLKPALNAAHYAQLIPNAKLELLPAGGHFLFVSSCSTFGKFISRFFVFDVCGNRVDVERRTAQQPVGSSALEFFDANIAGKMP